jgi:hypothetical protein
MIDRSRQLVIRVDLYASYIFLIAIVISICEIPVLMWRLDVGRYVLPIGWLALLGLGVRRMWTAKMQHDLTTELQAYKVVLCSIIVLGAASFAYMATHIAIATASRFTEIGLIVSVANGIVGLGVLAVGALTLRLAGKISALSHNSPFRD